MESIRHYNAERTRRRVDSIKAKLADPATPPEARASLSRSLSQHIRRMNEHSAGATKKALTEKQIRILELKEKLAQAKTVVARIKAEIHQESQP